MAVFMVNICKFNGCGLTFPNLADLIQHIEDIHIDYDPRVVEQKELQQPTCLPLSYVLRFFTDAARKEGHDTKRRFMQNHGPKLQLAASHRSNTPTGSEADEDDLSESEDSNDSWASEEINADFILKYGNRVTNPSSSSAVDKPYSCPVPGCKKRYKNVNGIKYHSKNGHKQDGKIRKGFNCHCGKSYKTCQGLRNHTSTHHSAGLTAFTTQNGEVLQVPANHVATLQPFHTVAVKQLTPAAIGLPMKTIQGLVVATKAADNGNKGTMATDNNFEAITFAKGSAALQMTMPTLISQPRLIVNSNSAEHQTLTTALGVLTPASSPHTPPPDPATVVTSSSSTAGLQTGISADTLQTTCQASEALVPNSVSPQPVFN